MRHRLTHDLGEVEVLVEVFTPSPLVVVGGATPVAEALLAGARILGWRTALVEPRGERVTGEHRRHADQVVAEPEDLPAGGDIAFVHTDHDAPDVVATLSHFLEAGAGFVGVMGSRRHTGAHFESMAAAGVPPEALERVRTPVGLDIGAQGPGEIALSILAGLVAGRHGRAGGWLG